MLEQYGFKTKLIKTIYCVTTKITLNYSSETNGLSMSIKQQQNRHTLSFNIVMFKASKTASFLDIKPLNLL
jgi:hypothetical protein